MIQNDYHLTRSPHLSTAELRALLNHDADDGHGHAAHLDACTMCQSRLTSLAADPSVWSDAQSFLSGASDPRWEPDTSKTGISLSSFESPCPPPAQELALKLLDPPNHPEMLGRLGRYDIERVIGNGGMGIVLKAHDSELNRPIAIKLLAPHLAHVGPARERFSREGRAAAAVVHEHVVAIYNVESSGPLPFLVMQYVPGRSLEARVSEDGPLSVEEILRIGIQAASGLAAAHRQGLVHRDVKPANILLENSVERAILTDFGLARAIDDASLTQTGILAGTPHYMSPEQAQGEAIDHRSDLFSLGAVLYFMATGHPPFRASTALAVLHRICREPYRPAWQVNTQMPDELCDVIDRLLEKKPSRRYATAEEVQQVLASLLARAQRQGLGRRRFRRWRGMRFRHRLASAAALLAVCLVAIVSITWTRSATHPTTENPVGQAPHEPEPKAESEAPPPLVTDGEFVDHLGATLGELDAASAGTHYLQGGDDVWYQELEAVHRALDVLESQTSNVSD